MNSASSSRASIPTRCRRGGRIDRNVALAEIEFLLHQHQVLRHQERALDSYVDEPFRGVDWQNPGHDSDRVRHLRNRIGMAGGHCPDPGGACLSCDRGTAVGRRCCREKTRRIGGMLRDHGLLSTAADAEYFSKTLPQIAEPI